MEYQAIKDFVSFLKKPDNVTCNLKSSVIYLSIFKIYIFLLIITLLIGLLNKIIFQDAIVNDIVADYSSDELQKYISNPWLLFFILLLIFPAIEEFSYRLFLTGYNRYFLSISLSLIVGDFVSLLFDIQFLYTEHLHINYLIVLFFHVVLSIPFFVFFFFLTKKNVIELFWNKYFPYIFYIASFLFAIVHLQVLSFSHVNIFLIILSISPFFVFGLGLGFIRIRYGFKYSILVHVAVNTPTLTYLFLNL
jgi:hypothetical protein